MGPPPRPSFSAYDQNSNGVVDAEEFRIGQAKRITERAKEGRAMRNASSRYEFADVDTNKDGKITQKEFETVTTKRRW